MNNTELTDRLTNTILENREYDVKILLNQPSVGPRATADVIGANAGIDWESHMLLLTPGTPLVSWEYLERLLPDIHEQLDAARRAFNEKWLEEHPRKVRKDSGDASAREIQVTEEGDAGDESSRVTISILPLLIDDRSGLISDDDLPECSDEFKQRVSREIDEMLGEEQAPLDGK